MTLRKLRLQQGWSQEQVAQMTDLSVRTIQRIERGGQPSLESAKALAAVFEVALKTFYPTSGDHNMNPSNKTSPATESNPLQPVSAEEKSAINYVKGVKEFYGHLGMYVIFMLVFFITGKFDQTVGQTNLMWLSLGWAAGVLVHGLVAFELFGSFSTQWEKQQIEKRLGRKL